MIIGAQWEQQHSTASHFIDVPYADVTLSTRIGLVAGMLLILFYQKDYWVASTLLEIRYFGRAGGEMRGEKTDDKKKDAEIGYKPTDFSIFFPSIIRLIDSVHGSNCSFDCAYTPK